MKKYKYKKYGILILIINIFTLPSYGEIQKMNEKHIIFYSQSKAENPWTGGAGSTFPFLTAVLGNLVSINNNAEIYPSTLKSFDYNFKENSYYLRLKADLIFHNGRIATAQDLEFSIARYFFAKEANEGTMVLVNLNGVDKIKPGQIYKPGLIDGVKIIDDLTVAVTLLKPNPSFLYTLAHFIPLVPQEELKEDYLTWKKWPVGTGAYKIISENKKEKTTLLSLVNEKDYPNAPKEILFEQNRIYEPDITLSDNIASNDINYLQEELTASMGVRTLLFNFSSELGENLDFRKAVSFAISRKEIVENVKIKSKILFEVIPEGNIGRIHVKDKQNTEEAERLLNNLLSKNSKKTFIVPYTQDDSYLGSNYRSILKSQLAKVGLYIEFRELKPNALFDPFSGEFENSPFFMVTTGSDYFDPLLSFVGFKKGSSPLKKAIPKDNKINELIKIAEDAPSRDILNINLMNLSKYFYENRITIPLFMLPTVVYYKPGKIQSIGKQFGGVVFYLHNIEIVD